MVAALVRRLRDSSRTHSLFQNSIYLMLSTGTIAGFAFLFWVICARLFTRSEIGTATTLISAITVISYASLLGFKDTFVRFLPTSTERNNELNTGLVLAGRGNTSFSGLSYRHPRCRS
jgi:O-antigen/teichoic acid export membrane protein